MPLASSIFLLKGFPRTGHHSSPTDHKTHYARKKSTFHRPVMRQLQCNRRSKKKKKENPTPQSSPEFLAATKPLKLRPYFIEKAGIIFKSNSV